MYVQIQHMKGKAEVNKHTITSRILLKIAKEFCSVVFLNDVHI